MQPGTKHNNASCHQNPSQQHGPTGGDFSLMRHPITRKAPLGVCALNHSFVLARITPTAKWAKRHSSFTSPFSKPQARTATRRCRVRGGPLHGSNTWKQHGPQKRHDQSSLTTSTRPVSPRLRQKLRSHPCTTGCHTSIVHHCNLTSWQRSDASAVLSPSACKNHGKRNNKVGAKIPDRGNTTSGTEIR